MDYKISKQTIVLGVILVVLSQTLLKNIIPLWISVLVLGYGVSKNVYIKVKPWIDEKLIDYGENPNGKTHLIINYLVSFSITLFTGAAVFLIIKSIFG